MARSTRSSTPPPADGIKTVEALGLGENGRYITALTFGNVHGAYKPGHVKLRPELLGTIQKEVAEHFGLDHRPFDLVMHGGSGSTAEEIATAVANGVIKIERRHRHPSTRSPARSSTT